MGTRGLWGFYKDGKTKATYNHFDSYPSYLGVNLVEVINRTTLEQLTDVFDRIVLVEEEEKPTEQKINECLPYFDGSVSMQTTDDWYCLLRGSQGDLTAYTEKGLRYMIDSEPFIGDSLFCEWAYIMNLTDSLFEVYRGFKETIDSNEQNRYRYYGGGSMKYKACHLLITFPLFDIPDDWLEQVEELDRDEEDEADAESGTSHPHL